jgi:hypothetical protein
MRDRPSFRPSLFAVTAGMVVCSAFAQEAPQEPAPQPAQEAPARPPEPTFSSTVDPTPAETPEPKEKSMQERARSTLISMQDFIDELVEDWFGLDPKRRYRVDGKKKFVDLGKRWTLSLDQRPTGLLGNIGVGIPAAGQPSRLWELSHDGRNNDVRIYNHEDGSGREFGLADFYTIAPGWKVYGQGMRLEDSYSGVKRTEAQAGLRVGDDRLWVEGFARYAELRDDDNTQNWGSDTQKGNFAGLKTQWNVGPRVSLTAQTQHPFGNDLSPGDERLGDARTEFGAEYRPDGGFTGTRFYWREATQLGLLSSNGLEERATYKRVIGVETPEGSEDGMVYGQLRQKSLMSDDDALLVLGWRHTAILAPQWSVFTLLETGIPVSGDNAIRSNTFDIQLAKNAFPDHSFRTEVQAVKTPVKDSGFFNIEYTERLTRNTLGISRISVTGERPGELAPVTDIPNNSGEFFAGWGWQEPQQRRVSTFWRYRLLGRNALNDNDNLPGASDRRAHIGSGELTWKAESDLTWLLRNVHRFDRDEAVQDAALRTSNMLMLRASHRLVERWTLSAHVAQLNDSMYARQTSVGAEISVKVSRKLVLAIGYNPKGFDDDEMAEGEKLDKGFTARAYVPFETTLARWLAPPIPQR